MKMCMKPLDFFKFDLCEDRDYSKSLSFIMKSIRRYGFVVPVIALPDGQIVCGQLRVQAAKKLEEEEIPCVIVEDWDIEDAKEFSFIENKIGTKSTYPGECVEAAMQKYRVLKHYGYRQPKKKVATDEVQYKSFEGIVKKRRHIRCGNFFYLSFLKTTKKLELGSVKKQPDFYDYIIEKMADHITTQIKQKQDFCIVYAPKRRTLVGNVAELIAMGVGERTGIKVYEDAFVCHNRNRINPEFELAKVIPETNVILIDDILTTGSTVTHCVALLENKNVQVLIGLCNKYS